jgi:hypothetical protein
MPIILDNTVEGALYIDAKNGVITFLDRDGNRLLRVTHLPTPIPPNVMVDVTAIRNVTSYNLIDPPPLSDRPVSADLGANGLVSKESWDENPDLRCPVCTRIHTSGEYVKWGPYTFIQGHEYIVWTRNSQQTYAHRGRMQFLGRGTSSFRYQLAFNARGPDRSTSNKFGGTQQLDARNIVKVEEVEVIPSERYVDEIDRSMKRDDK